MGRHKTGSIKAIFVISYCHKFKRISTVAVSIILDTILMPDVDHSKFHIVYVN